MLFTITLLGHALTLWENIGIAVAFAVVMIMLAIWSFSKQNQTTASKPVFKTAALKDALPSAPALLPHLL